MITLAPAESIRGVSSAGATITYTITGMTLVAGVESYGVIAQGQLPAVAGVLYTAPGGTQAFLKTIILTNTSVNSVSGNALYINGVAATNLIAGPMTLLGKSFAILNQTGWETYDGNGRIMNTGSAAAVTWSGINVRDYGALGDGATDDRAAIQAAIAAAAAAGVGGRGVEVFFPAGIYQVTGTLTVTQNNIWLRGAGRGSTVILPNFLIGDVIQFGNGIAAVAQVGIMDMQIFSSAARTSGAHINVNLAHDVMIERVDMNNPVVGILVQGASLKVRIDACTINTILVTTGIGIQVNNGLGGDTYINRVIMTNPPASKPLAGINLVCSGHTSILQCNVTSCIHGLYINPGANQDVQYIFCDHSLFDSCGSNAMYIFPGAFATARVRSFTAVNSWFAGSTSNPGYGIQIAGGAASVVDDIAFVGCRILSNFTHGVYWTYASAVNISFNDCTIAGNSAGGAGSDAVNIAANCSFFSFANNKIGQSGTSGNTQRYAVNIAAGTSGNFQFIGNDFAPNLTAPYVLLGALTGISQLWDSNYPGPNYPSMSTRLGAPVATVGVAETLIMNYRVPLNSVQVGSTFCIACHGISSSTGTLIFRVRVGALGTVAGDAQCWISITSAAQVANQRAGFTGLLTVRALGAPGNIQCECLGYAQAALLPTVVGAVAVTNATTTALWYIDISCTCSVGTWTCQEATIGLV